MSSGPNGRPPESEGSGGGNHAAQPAGDIHPSPPSPVEASLVGQDAHVGASVVRRSNIYDLLNPSDSSTPYMMASSQATVSSRPPLSPHPTPSFWPYEPEQTPGAGPSHLAAYVKAPHECDSERTMDTDDGSLRRATTGSPVDFSHTYDGGPPVELDDDSWRQYMAGSPTDARCTWRDVLDQETGREGPPCDFVGRTNATRRHIETTHLGIKRFECLRCHRRFPQKSSLDRHTNTHTGERPYECPYAGCLESFADRARLHRHKVQVHKHIARKRRRQKRQEADDE